MRKSTGPKTASVTGNSVHILIVEDEEGLRQIYEQVLSKEFRVTSASTSQDAIQLINSEASFGFLITDFLLDRAFDIFLNPQKTLNSQGDGLDVALAFRSRYPNTPMIMSTNSSADYFPRIRKFCELGNCCLVEKVTFATHDLGKYMRIALEDIRSAELPSSTREDRYV